MRAELAQHADRRRRGVEDVHAEPFRDPPEPSGVGIGGHALVHHAGRAQGEGAVHDVGVPGDPSDVGRAPVGVVRVDVLVVLRGSGDVGEIPAGAVLAALGPPGGAAGIHEEQRRLGRHGHRFHDPAAVVDEQVVDEEVAAGDHRAGRRVLAGMSAPHEHLLDLVPEPPGGLHRLVGLRLMVDELPVAVVAVHRDQNAALRVSDAVAARCTAEPAEDLRMDDAQPGAGQHRDRQLGDHRQVEGDAVAGLGVADTAQQRRELVHLPIQLLVGDRLGGLRLRLGHPDERGLVRAGGQVPVDTVVAGVEPAADKPLPERRVAGVERGVPIGIPGEQVGVFLEAFREVRLTEAFEQGGVGAVRLGDERRRRMVVFLLAPVHRDLCFGDLRPLRCCHRFPQCRRWIPERRLRIRGRRIDPSTLRTRRADVRRRPGQ